MTLPGTTPPSRGSDMAARRNRAITCRYARGNRRRPAPAFRDLWPLRRGNTREVRSALGEQCVSSDCLPIRQKALALGADVM